MVKIHERFQISFDKILVIIYSGMEIARLSLGLCSWDKRSWKIVVDLLNPQSDVLLIPFPNGYRNFHASIGHVVTHRHFPFLRFSLKYIKP